MSDSAFHVAAKWDAEAGVWTSSSNIPGLVVEAANAVLKQAGLAKAF